MSGTSGTGRPCHAVTAPTVVRPVLPIPPAEMHRVLAADRFRSRIEPIER